MSAATKHDEFIDPDPMTIFLGVLGIAGSIASIAAYLEYRRNQRRQTVEERRKLVREARDLLMALEADVMQTEASLRKLEFILIEGTSEYHSLPLTEIRLQFGTCKPLFTLHGYQKYDEILDELNRLVGRGFTTTSRLIQKLYNIDVEIDNDNELQHRLVELQHRLNAMMRGDFTYEQGFREYYEMISFTKEIVRDIRNAITRYMNR